MKIGILGGTFNPIHFAHLRISEEAREAFALDQVLFVPAATPPHKTVAGSLSFERRLEMVRLAVEDREGFHVSDLEGRRGGTSYSVVTLQELRALHPQDELFFIMGSDSFADIATWRDYAAILAAVHIIVVGRPGAALATLTEALPVEAAREFCYHSGDRRLEHVSGCCVHYIEGVPLDISSSAIRALSQKGRSIRYLVPERVRRYIEENDIYA